MIFLIQFLLILLHCYFIPFTFSASNFASRINDSSLLFLYTFEEGQSSPSASRSLDLTGQNLLGDLLLGSDSSKWLGYRNGISAIGTGLEYPAISAATIDQIVTRVIKSKQFTFEIWLQPDILVQSAIAAGFGDWKPNEYEPVCSSEKYTLALTQNEYQYASSIATGSVLFGCASTPIAADIISEPIQIVSTADGKVTRTYLNGGSKFSSITMNTNYTFWDRSDKLVISPTIELLSGNSTWRGSIFLIAMYDRALNKTEINRNYLAGLPNSKPFPLLATQSVPTVLNELTELNISFSFLDADNDPITIFISSIPLKGILYYQTAENSSILQLNSSILPFQIQSESYRFYYQNTIFNPQTDSILRFSEFQYFARDLVSQGRTATVAIDLFMPRNDSIIVSAMEYFWIQLNSTVGGNIGEFSVSAIIESLPAKGKLFIDFDSPSPLLQSQLPYRILNSNRSILFFPSALTSSVANSGKSIIDSDQFMFSVQRSEVSSISTVGKIDISISTPFQFNSNSNPMIINYREFSEFTLISLNLSTNFNYYPISLKFESWNSNEIQFGSNYLHFINPGENYSLLVSNNANATKFYVMSLISSLPSISFKFRFLTSFGFESPLFTVSFQVQRTGIYKRPITDNSLLTEYSFDNGQYFPAQRFIPETGGKSFGNPLYSSFGPLSLNGLDWIPRRQGISKNANSSPPYSTGAVSSMLQRSQTPSIFSDIIATGSLSIEMWISPDALQLDSKMAFFEISNSVLSDANSPVCDSETTDNQPIFLQFLQLRKYFQVKLRSSLLITSGNQTASSAKAYCLQFSTECLTAPLNSYTNDPNNSPQFRLFPSPLVSKPLHVVFQANSTSMQLYFNGISAAQNFPFSSNNGMDFTKWLSDSKLNFSPRNIIDFNINRNGSNGNDKTWNGEFHYFAMRNKILNDFEVRNLWLAGLENSVPSISPSNIASTAEFSVNLNNNVIQRIENWNFLGLDWDFRDSTRLQTIILAPPKYGKLFILIGGQTMGMHNKSINLLEFNQNNPQNFKLSLLTANDFPYRIPLEYIENENSIYSSASDIIPNYSSSYAPASSADFGVFSFYYLPPLNQMGNLPIPLFNEILNWTISDGKYNKVNKNNSNINNNNNINMNNNVNNSISSISTSKIGQLHLTIPIQYLAPLVSNSSILMYYRGFQCFNLTSGIGIDFMGNLNKNYISAIELFLTTEQTEEFNENIDYSKNINNNDNNNYNQNNNQINNQNNNNNNGNNNVNNIHRFGLYYLYDSVSYSSYFGGINNSIQNKLLYSSLANSGIIMNSTRINQFPFILNKSSILTTTSTGSNTNTNTGTNTGSVLNNNNNSPLNSNNDFQLCFEQNSEIPPLTISNNNNNNNNNVNGLNNEVLYYRIIGADGQKSNIGKLEISFSTPLITNANAINGAMLFSNATIISWSTGLSLTSVSPSRFPVENLPALTYLKILEFPQFGSFFIGSSVNAGSNANAAAAAGASNNLMLNATNNQINLLNNPNLLYVSRYSPLAGSSNPVDKFRYAICYEESNRCTNVNQGIIQFSPIPSLANYSVRCVNSTALPGVIGFSCSLNDSAANEVYPTRYWRVEMNFAPVKNFVLGDGEAARALQRTQSNTSYLYVIEGSLATVRLGLQLMSVVPNSKYTSGPFVIQMKVILINPTIPVGYSQRESIQTMKLVSVYYSNEISSSTPPGSALFSFFSFLGLPFDWLAILILLAVAIIVLWTIKWKYKKWRKRRAEAAALAIKQKEKAEEKAEAAKEARLSANPAAIHLHFGGSASGAESQVGNQLMAMQSISQPSRGSLMMGQPGFSHSPSASMSFPPLFHSGSPTGSLSMNNPFLTGAQAVGSSSMVSPHSAALGAFAFAGSPDSFARYSQSASASAFHRPSLMQDAFERAYRMAEAEENERNAASENAGVLLNDPALARASAADENQNAFMRAQTELALAEIRRQEAIEAVESQQWKMVRNSISFGGSLSSAASPQSSPSKSGSHHIRAASVTRLMQDSPSKLNSANRQSVESSPEASPIRPAQSIPRSSAFAVPPSPSSSSFASLASRFSVGSKGPRRRLESNFNPILEQKEVENNSGEEINIRHSNNGNQNQNENSMIAESRISID